MADRRCILCERTGVHFNNEAIDVCSACASPEAVRQRIDNLPDSPVKTGLIRSGVQWGLIDRHEGDPVA